MSDRIAAIPDVTPNRVLEIEVQDLVAMVFFIQIGRRSARVAMSVRKLRMQNARSLFLQETDPISSSMKARGLGELGICGIAAAIANAIYNATGIRVRDYPITLDKYLDKLPEVGSSQT